MPEPADRLHALRNALELLLADVEAIAGTPKCYGMPVEHPDHPFHDSVKAAREALSMSQSESNGAMLNKH